MTPHDPQQMTLDGLLRRNAQSRPDAVALCDPPNRPDFTEGAPRRLTYAQADHIVSAIAGRLRRLGLPAGATVGLQLPNTVESVLAFLGVLRAGMIAAPLPILWRRADASAALNRVGAKALVTVSRIGATDHCRLAMDVAAEVFPIRYVGSFGRALQDGVIALDDTLEPSPLLDRPDGFARETDTSTDAAAVTFEVTPDGPMPVARTHAELIAGGQALRLEAALQDGGTLLVSCGAGSFAGLALGIVPWLLTGGTLVLHHAFDAAAFAEQCRNECCDAVVLPGPLVAPIAQAGLLAHAELRSLVALWRAPERLPTGSSWRHPQAELTDVLAFGETGLIAARRGGAGQPAGIPLGAVQAPRGAFQAATVLETSVTRHGTLALRGPMVPSGATDERGFADTRYPCRADAPVDELVVSGPPPGIVSVGGYRFMPARLQELLDRAAPEAMLAALPDALSGHRLAGSAPDRAAARQALQDLGLNPLVGGAFGERRRVAAIRP